MTSQQTRSLYGLDAAERQIIKSEIIQFIDDFETLNDTGPYAREIADSLELSHATVALWLSQMISEKIIKGPGYGTRKGYRINKRRKS